MKTKKLLLMLSIIMTTIACQKKDEPYLLNQGDITFPELLASNELSVQVGQLLRVDTESVSDENVIYEWLLDGVQIAQTKDLEWMIEVAGKYELELIATQNSQTYSYKFNVLVNFGEIAPPDEGATAYITKVLDYLPAPAQFVNKLPKYNEGDTQETMNAKVLESIGNNKKRMITLGSYGGYVIVGFDHTIQNIEGKRDFRVIGNAFYSAANPDSNAPEGGSCEPGIIMVAYDANENGVPDDNEWYEIAGSSHEDVTLEPWYQKAVDNGNDVNFYFNDFELTYTKPENLTPANGTEEFTNYIPWRDNKGGDGFVPKNIFHRQSWFPGWVTTNEIRFRGSRLPQNGIDESGEGKYYVLYKFRYGYADNETNTKDDSAIDISWAVNSKGQRVNLPGVDFIKIYNGVNQVNGWLGECSAEITNIEDLHILGIDIPTR